MKYNRERLNLSTLDDFFLYIFNLAQWNENQLKTK